MAVRRAWLVPTGAFIREFLLTRKEGYAYEIWKALKEERRRWGLVRPSYRAFWNYFLILQKLGLIRVVRVERGLPKARWWRKYYEITPDMREHPAWFAPQKALYPLTGLGPKYKRIREEAEARRIRVGTFFIRQYPDRVEEIAKRFRISKAEAERRIRPRRSPPARTEAET